MISALIGMTALAEHCALISSDRRLRKRAIELGIEVLHGRALLAELGYTNPSTEPANRPNPEYPTE